MQVGEVKWGERGTSAWARSAGGGLRLGEGLAADGGAKPHDEHAEKGEDAEGAAQGDELGQAADKGWADQEAGVAGGSHGGDPHTRGDAGRAGGGTQDQREDAGDAGADKAVADDSDGRRGGDEDQAYTDD